MIYSFTRNELKNQKGIDFKEKDIICIEDRYEIEISYGKEQFKKPSMCSKVFDLRRMKYQDVVFRPNYISEFLRRA